MSQERQHRHEDQRNEDHGHERGLAVCHVALNSGGSGEMRLETPSVAISKHSAAASRKFDDRNPSRSDERNRPGCLIRIKPGCWSPDDEGNAADQFGVEPVHQPAA